MNLLDFALEIENLHFPLISDKLFSEFQLFDETTRSLFEIVVTHLIGSWNLQQSSAAC